MRQFTGIVTAEFFLPPFAISSIFDNIRLNEAYTYFRMGNLWEMSIFKNFKMLIPIAT